MSHQTIPFRAGSPCWTLKPLRTDHPPKDWWCLYQWDKHIACIEDEQFAREVCMLFEEEPTPLAAIRAFQHQQKAASEPR